MYLTQGLKRAVQVNAEGIATIDGERVRSWRECGARVAKLAGALNSLGVASGDRVAILANNSDRYFESYFATLWAGGAVVPLNIRWVGPELVYSLNDSGARLLIVDEAFYALAESIRGQLESVTDLIYADSGETQVGALNYEQMLAKAAPVEDALRGGDDLAGIFYTGGTTGLSKGVMLTHTNLAANALSTIGQLGLRMNDRYLHAAPMFHLADGLSTWAITMVAGTHVFVPRFVPQTVLQQLEAQRITYITLVPTLLQMLLDQLDQLNQTPYDLSALQTLFYGASPMPRQVLQQAMSVLPTCRFFGAFGMTELAPIATVLYPEYHQLDGDSTKLRSVGQATLGVEVRVVDEQGQEVPRGTVGEIIVRGPNVMRGYWNKPEQTAVALKNGWMHSGDGGYMDEEGFLYIVDRLKDMIISGGENIYSTEVENAIYEHPGVAQVAVIGIPDDKWGESVKAIVVPKAGTTGATLTEAELIRHCQARIAGYKCPRRVDFRDQPLPLSGAGKVLKTELRAPYWKGREKQVN